MLMTFGCTSHATCQTHTLCVKNADNCDERAGFDVFKSAEDELGEDGIHMAGNSAGARLDTGVIVVAFPSRKAQRTVRDLGIILDKNLFHGEAC